MTDGLNGTQIRILTWVVYALLFLLTSVTAWLCVDRMEMPNNFVRLERYQADQCKSEKVDDRILTKLDKIYDELRQK